MIFNTILWSDQPFALKRPRMTKKLSVSERFWKVPWFWPLPFSLTDTRSGRTSIFHMGSNDAGPGEDIVAKRSTRILKPLKKPMKMAESSDFC